MRVIRYLCLSLFLTTTGYAQAGLSPQRVLEELKRVADNLQNCSVEVESVTRASTAEGPRTTETRERIYYGNLSQERRDLLSSTGPEIGFGPPEDSGRRMRGRGAGLPDRILRVLEPRSLIASIEQVEPAKSSAGKNTVFHQFRAQPKLPQVRTDQSVLTVDPEKGWPVTLEMRFSVGFFIQDARLRITFEAIEGREVTVPSEMSMEFKMGMGGFRGAGGPAGPPGEPGLGRDFGGPGGEFSIQLTRSYSEYEWGLALADDFFAASAVSPRFENGRPGQSARETPQQDPFEEVSLLPDQVREPTPEPQVQSIEDVVFIQGASRAQSTGGFGEADVFRQILGMNGGTRGGGRFPGGGGPGDAGPGGGGPPGPGGFGGGRGGRLGGSRANRLQGTLELGFSGSALDARPYSLTGEENPAPEYHRWQAGLTIGGPISGLNSGMFPGRGQFFVGYNLSRGRQLSTSYGTVPTLLERGGDFSETTYLNGPLAGSQVKIFDPATGLPFENSILPESSLNPTALNLLSFFPEPNRQDSFLNYYTEQALGDHGDQVNVRLQAPVGSLFQVAGSYNFSRTASDLFNLFPGLASRRNGRGQNLGLSVNNPFRPGLINNIRVRYNRNNSETLNPFAFQYDVSRELGINGTSAAPIDFGLPTLSFTNYSAVNDGNSSVNVRETIGLGDSWMLVAGKHFFRLGVDYSWVRYNMLGSPNGSGTMTFAGIATSGYSGDLPIQGTGYDLADFLLGWVQSSQIQYGNSDHYARNHEFSVFVNDNWRAHSRFTLQWGLRYDYVAPFVEKYDRLSNLDIAPGFSSVETVVPGSPGPAFGVYPRALVKEDRNNFAPRVGLAFRLRTGRTPTILRAEYGVFYPGESYRNFWGELTAQSPFGYSVQEIAQGREFLELENAFSPTAPPEVGNTYAVDPCFRLQTVQNWGISIQQGLPKGLFASIGFVGSRGTGLELLRAPNRTSGDGLVIPDAAQFFYLTPGASSNFYGLQLLVMRRMRSSLSVSGQYEFGKSLDNASSIGGQGRTVAQNDDNLASERGLSSFDVRHRLSVRGMWGLPFGDRGRWMRGESLWSDLLRDWYLSGTFSADSGQPFTARVLGNQINNSGSGSFASERASVTGVSPELAPGDRATSAWFNTTAFRLPDPGAYGDAGRNTIPGPGSWTVDLSLHRSVRLRESTRLLISLLSRNLLNHPNYTSIDTVVNSRGFGQVTGVGSMRKIEFQLRLMF